MGGLAGFKGFSILTGSDCPFAFVSGADCSLSLDSFPSSSFNSPKESFAIDAKSDLSLKRNNSLSEGDLRSNKQLQAVL